MTDTTETTIAWCERCFASTTWRTSRGGGECLGCLRRDLAMYARTAPVAATPNAFDKKLAIDEAIAAGVDTLQWAYSRHWHRTPIGGQPGSLMSKEGLAEALADCRREIETCRVRREGLLAAEKLILQRQADEDEADTDEKRGGL